jgi:hypothetical protein
MTIIIAAQIGISPFFTLVLIPNINIKNSIMSIANRSLLISQPLSTTEDYSVIRFSPILSAVSNTKYRNHHQLQKTTL